MTKKQLQDTIEYARKIFNSIIIILQSTDNFNLSVTHKNVFVLRQTSSRSIGEYLNLAASYVKTRFTLVAPYLAKLDDFASIQRMIHGLEYSNSNIVGASIKDVITGEWDLGCFQQKLLLYILKYGESFPYNN